MSRRGVVAGSGNPQAKLAVVSITLALTAVVAYTNVYLPYYSPEATARREGVADGTIKAPDITPGSYWKQVSKVRDGER